MARKRTRKPSAVGKPYGLINLAILAHLVPINSSRLPKRTITTLKTALRDAGISCDADTLSSRVRSQEKLGQVSVKHNGPGKALSIKPTKAGYRNIRTLYSVIGG